MAEDSSTEKVNPGLVAEIVSSYVGKNSIAIDQIGPLIATVHRTLSSLGTNAPASAHRARARPGCLSHALEIGNGLPAHGTSLFIGALGDGQTARARPKAGRS